MPFRLIGPGRVQLIGTGHGALISGAVVGGGGTGDATATATLGTLDNYRVFQRDTYTGDLYGKGSGAVPVTMTPSATVVAVWMRLFDRTTGTSAPGSGTLVQDSVQVTGTPASMAAGVPVSFDVTVPAGDVLGGSPVGYYWLELALDSVFTNPVRLTTAIAVGEVFMLAGTTSHSSMFHTVYAYGSPQGTVNTILGGAPSPYALGYAPTVGGAFEGTLVANTWQTFGDGAAYPSTGGAEFLNRCIARLGVVCALVGTPSFGSYMYWWNPDNLGNSATSFWPPFAAIMDHTKDRNGKWKVEAAICIACSNDVVANVNSGRQVSGRQLAKFLTAIDAKSTAQVPVALMSRPQARDATDINTNARHYDLANRDVALTRANTTINNWHDFYYSSSGHSTMQSRVRTGRGAYRQVMLMMGPSKGGFSQGAGPRVTSVSRTGAVITFTLTHDGGTTLIAEKNTETSATTSTTVTGGSVTAAELATAVRIYPAGTTITPVALAGASQVTLTSNTIVVTLASDPGAAAVFDAFLGPTANVTIRDNLTDGDGITYGREIQTNLDPIFVPAVTPATLAITVTPPLPTAAGGYILLYGGGSGPPLTGAGTGLPASSLQVNVGGAGWVVPVNLVVLNNNSWSCFVVAPNTVGTGVSLQVRLTEQTTTQAACTVDIVTARDTLPSSVKASAVAFYDASNIGTLWQDITGNTTPTAELAQTRVWKDSLGTASNDAKQAGTALLAPYYVHRAPNYSLLDDRTADRPALFFERHPAGFNTYSRLTAASPALASQTGDITIVVASRSAVYGTLCWLGKTGGAAIAVDVDGNGYPGGFRKGTTGAVLNNHPAAQKFGRVTIIARYVGSTGMLTVDRSDRASETTTGPVADLAAVFDTLVLGADNIAGSQCRLHAVMFYGRVITGVGGSSPTLEMADVRAGVSTRWGDA